MNNLKIGTRLGIGFAVTLLLMVVIAAISYTRLAILGNEVQDMVGQIPQGPAGQRSLQRHQRRCPAIAQCPHHS